jgi:hypothetical protein
MTSMDTPSASSFLGLLDRLRAVAAPAPSPGGPPVPDARFVPRPVPPPAPARQVQIRLASGRTVKMALASRADLAGLATATAANDRQAFALLAQHQAALDGLALDQEALARKVAELAERSQAALLEMLQMLGNVKQATAAATATLSARTSTLGTTLSRQRVQLRTAARVASIQKVTDTVNSLQLSAFGDKGGVFTTNNLMLAANQLLWSYLGPALDALGPLAWLAPLGSLATGAATVGRRQHVRFVSGVTSVRAGAGGFSAGGAEGSARLLLADRIAPADWLAFRKRADIPVTATVLGAASGAGVRARVQDGFLLISVESATAGLVRVAWMVDTGLGDG